MFNFGIGQGGQGGGMGHIGQEGHIGQMGHGRGVAKKGVGTKRLHRSLLLRKPH